MKRALLIGSLLCVAAGAWVATSRTMASEVGFIEDFALSPDRAKVLPQLIGGTEDYYYFNCLALQQKGEFDKVDDLLAQWIAKFQYTPRVKEIELRQCLLTYEKDPAKSLAYLVKHLNLQFNAQRQVPGQKPDLPVALDQGAISRDTLTKAAMARYQNLDGFDDSALEWLSATQLNGDRLRGGWDDVQNGVRIPSFYNDTHIGANGFLRQFLRTADQRWFGLGEIA